MHAHTTRALLDAVRGLRAERELLSLRVTSCSCNSMSVYCEYMWAPLRTYHTLLETMSQEGQNTLGKVQNGSTLGQVGYKCSEFPFFLSAQVGVCRVYTAQPGGALHTAPYMLFSV